MAYASYELNLFRLNSILDKEVTRKTPGLLELTLACLHDTLIIHGGAFIGSHQGGTGSNMLPSEFHFRAVLQIVDTSQGILALQVKEFKPQRNIKGPTMIKMVNTLSSVVEKRFLYELGKESDLLQTEPSNRIIYFNMKKLLAELSGYLKIGIIRVSIQKSRMYIGLSVPLWLKIMLFSLTALPGFLIKPAN